MPTWKKLIVSGSDAVLSSVTTTNGATISGSFNVTGSSNIVGTTTMTGSLNISGSETITGYLQFEPVTTNLNNSISASYIYVSGSTNDLYFTQNGAGYGNTTRLRWLEGNLYTGLLHGGIITSQSSTSYQISSGSGVIVTLNASTTSDPYPTVQFLNWPNLSSSIATLSASFDQQFVAVSSSGGTAVIKAQGTPYNDGDYNTSIPIGIVIHQNRSTINAVQTFPGVAYGWKQRSFDFIKAFGPLKISGYTLSQSGSSTRGLVLSGGTAWVDGRNYIVDPNNPSYITEASGITTSKIYRYRQSGSGWAYDTNGGAGYTDIDPTQYSNNGTLTSVSTNHWTIQRVFYFPNSATKAFYIYYGNAEYANEAEALAAVTTETFAEAPNTAANAIYVGFMLLRHNADFTVPASHTFYAGGLFRASGTGGGGGGGGSTALSGLTDVSLSSLADGDLLRYNSSTGLWNNTKILTGSYVLSGSLTTDGSVWVQTLTASFVSASSITGSLFGTASWAQSSSQALTASYTPNALITASVSSNVITFTKGNGTTFNLTVNTGSGGGGSTSPGGLNTQIQFNSASAFNGSQYFTYYYQSQSLQQGEIVSATGFGSHAEGYNTTAQGDYSHAEGGGTTTSEQYAHAEGQSTQATAQAAHAEGSSTQASGIASHAEGISTIATGSYSHAEGFTTTAAGTYSHTEGVLTSTYRTTPTAVSSSENLYAYNIGSGLLVGDSAYTTTAQNFYVLWEDVDSSQVWLSNVNGVYNADPDGSGTRTIFSISEFDSQGPSTNVTTGGSVYDFETAANTWGPTPYNYGKFDYDNNLIEVYDVDLTAVAAADGVLVTVPNSGSYAYNISNLTYSSNTSSITIGADQFGGVNSGAPSLSGAVITSGKLFLTNITGSSWSPEGSLINSLIGVDSYYNFTSKTFKLAGGIGFVIKPNTIAIIDGNDRLLTGANFDGTYSYITTSAQLDPIYGVANIPLIEFGNGSHTGGNNTVAYGNYQTVVGRYNTNSNYKDLFVVGGGDSNTRKDVLAVSTTDITMSGSVNISGSLLVNGSAPGGGSAIKAGSVSSASFGGSPRTGSVTFTTPFSDNNYSITVTGEDARSWSIQSKTSNSFVINSNSSVALNGHVYWIATPFANS